MKAAPVVFAISLAALAAVTVPYYRNDTQKRRQRLTLDRMELIASAIERYRMKNGRYPEAADGAALLKQVELPDFTKPAGADGRPTSQTLDPRDGWGRPMTLQSTPDGYWLVSNGRDFVRSGESLRRFLLRTQPSVVNNAPAIIRAAPTATFQVIG